ncbi:MAG: ornithine cyclodeaminase family protein [Candidatus Eiseniibacteriota bacterium]|jgi:ornithine cyclodeaminase/alanine dehydrogenase-like protein (mu-crystallin family)
MTKLLSRDDVARVLEMPDTIEILERAFGDFGQGNAEMPQRTPIAAPDHGGLALFMPAYLKGMGALGAKVVTVYKDNPAKFDLATVLGTIILLDQRTGAPLAVMDGGYLTAMRTGGVAGLATKLMAREEARVHVMFGTGGMARTHAWAVDCARSIERLVLYSIDPPDRRRAFADSLRDVVKSEIVLADDPAAAVGEADVVTLITSAREPIVQGDWFRPGTHINGIGSHAPAMRELDAATVARSTVVCDLVDACKAEAGDLILPAESGEWSWDRVHGSLGDVVLGRVPGRRSADEITLFKSVGLAIQDISVAQHVYAQAVKLGAGQDFTF